ncbi:MAG: cadmium-translocating P-type ATPase [Clostridia bacterium]|nr:cadmium-translocating P-type ATPase [Clostridia bacterium]
MNKFKITGLDCANCARELEEEISKIEGVKEATVDFMAQKVLVDCDGETLEKVKYCCNHFEEVKVVEETPSAQSAPAERVYGEKIKITGLCCANCARELEEDLNKIDGVEATVDFVNMRVVLNANSSSAREKAIYAITHFEDVKIDDGKGEKKSPVKEHLKDIICLVVAVALFVPALVMDLTGFIETSLAVKIITYVLYGLAYLAVGHPVLINTAKNIVKGKIFDENFLMTIASVGAILLGIFAGDGFFEGVAVMLLYQLGELLQSLAVGSSRKSITKLMDLKSDTATLLIDGEQRTVSPEELRAGDIIIIKAGEKVPVDCKIVKGQSSLDLKSLNGEPVPRDVAEGDEALSGSINLSGVIEAEVIREYKNSAVAKILELVENSTAKKAKPEKFITKFAKYYTPAVCICAVILAGIVPTIICAVNALFVWDVYRDWIYKALNFLVISCPCALVISVPLSYFGGIGRCAKFGVLVKGSTCLDELALAKTVLFDKTGTLTEGSFHIVNYTDERTLTLAGVAEKFSSHPIAVAFKDIATGLKADSAEEVAGQGVKCIYEGKILLCGNGKLLKENGVACEERESVSTVVYVAYDGKFVGFIEIDDKIKEGAKECVEELKKQGITYTAMLTGDKKERAKIIAEKVGLDGCKAELLPDGKLEEATALKERGKLIYVGDGINDAPVMTCADCAVSMGKVGSDSAIEASDIVLVSDNLKLLPKGRKIAKSTRRLVIENIAGSLLVKAVIMALSVAIAGFPLIISVVADVGVMLLAVLNAMRTNLIK